MKTKRHQIDGASLSNIEEMAQELGHDHKPDWVPHTVKVEGTETSALDEAMTHTQDFSGLLRECSRCDFVTDGINVVDEDGGLHDLEWLLDEAAERLDQAHEEWLDNELQKRKERPHLLSESELQDLRMVLMHYAEEDPDEGPMVDNLWNKLKEAKA